MSASEESSAKSWLMPLMLGTNNMADGRCRARIMASWAAALGMSIQRPGAMRSAAWPSASRRFRSMTAGGTWARDGPVATATGPSASSSAATSLMACSIRSRVGSSASRYCTVAVAAPGMMLSAPGSNRTLPMVHTLVGPATSAIRARTLTANSNRATPASARRSIGVVPAWFCSPLKLTRAARMPTMDVTTPIWWLCSSR